VRWWPLGLLRFVLFALLVLAFIAAFLLTGIVQGFAIPRGMRYRRTFCRWIAPVLGVVISSRGAVSPGGPFLLVSNHRSYFDPVATLMHYTFAYPVAKAEVSSWPLVSWGANLSGVLYVRRDKSSSRVETRQAIQEYLKSGKSILVYAEGTTHTNERVMPFRPGTFRIAASNDVPVVPIAIDYRDVRDAFVGDDKFVPHFLKTYSKWKSEVKIAFGEPIRNSDPNQIIETATRWINEQLLEFRTEWTSQAQPDHLD
jgi:1-acyl-sn-glycerol-3-phosphate acyltransferase